MLWRVQTPTPQHTPSVAHRHRRIRDRSVEDRWSSPHQTTEYLWLTASERPSSERHASSAKARVTSSVLIVYHPTRPRARHGEVYTKDGWVDGYHPTTSLSLDCPPYEWRHVVVLSQVAPQERDTPLPLLPLGGHVLHICLNTAVRSQVDL